MALHGDSLAACSAGLTIYLWSTGAGKVTATLTSPAVMTSIAFSPDGQTLATGDMRGHVYLWNIAAKRITR